MSNIKDIFISRIMDNLQLIYTAVRTLGYISGNLYRIKPKTNKLI